MTAGLALVLEAQAFAQFDDQNLAAVPAPVREALHDLLDELGREYAAAQEYAAVQIWASIQRHAGDPRWEYVSDGWQAGEHCT